MESYVSEYRTQMDEVRDHEMGALRHVAYIINPNNDQLFDDDDRSALNSGAIVSDLLIPGDTETATIFDFWLFWLTTGTVLLPSSVLGTWAAEGKASRIRWRCRVNIADWRARCPSGRNIEVDLRDVGFVFGDGDGEKEGAAAA